MDAISEKLCQVGIVGGGKGGLELLKIFSKVDSAHICFVCDTNPQAPAMEFARSIGINTETNIEKALTSHDTSFILEATGSAKVYELIKTYMKQGAELISSNVALLFYQMMLENTRKMINNEVIKDLTGMKDEINSSMDSVTKSLGGINKVALDLSMLALNARIEAAHAKQYGKGFSVVADEVKNSSKAVQLMAEDIARVNDKILYVAEEIDVAINRLQ